MARYRKVTGERIVAALVDGVIMYFLGTLVTIIPMIFIGFDNFFEMIFATAFDTTGDMVSNEYMMFTAVSVYLSTAVGIVYFVVVPWKWNGQTIGKKLMSLKAINEYGENPSFMQHFVRAVQNWATYFSALIGWLVFINYIIFGIVSILSFVVYIAFIVAFIMMLAREDGRGLHDLMANTYVIHIDENLNKDFAEKTAQMGDWVEVEDKDDDWDKKEEDTEEDDEWNF